MAIITGYQTFENEKYLVWVDRLSESFLIAIGILLGITQRK